MTSPPRYPRDMRGYGANTPDPKWPGRARVAVQIVLNYEEGGENCLLHGDPASEAFLSEIVGAAPWPGQRHANMESFYEYGARAGFWRLHRMFTNLRLPVTVFGVATALARAPDQVAAMQDAGWEIASHGLKWIEHKDMDKAEERRNMIAAIALHQAVTGARPKGWYTGRSSINTLDLASEHGFAYLADSYADDLPYWRGDQLIVPYTLDANDMRFATPQGFNAGDQFETYLKDSFDVLYEEGMAGAPKMLSIGLHCRLVGRPGRAAALKRALSYMAAHEGVWFATRLAIAEHWHAVHGQLSSSDRSEFLNKTVSPADLSREAFMSHFDGIYEHSPWVAERTYESELGPVHNTAHGIASALAQTFRNASYADRLGVLTAHPDLAGKLANAKRLTKDSTVEQASAGLDALTDAERAKFEGLNVAYTEKHGFPFIIAVRDHTKTSILRAFETRLSQDNDIEFEEACRQVIRIATLRIQQLFNDTP